MGDDLKPALLNYATPSRSLPRPQRAREGKPWWVLWLILTAAPFVLMLLYVLFYFFTNESQQD